MRGLALDRKFWFLLILLFGAGILFRVGAVYFNLPFLHGRWLYGNAAQSLAERGDFKIATYDASEIPHIYSVREKGGEFLEHNPLWSILGAGIVLVSPLNGFEATQALSFLAGIAVLILIYRAGLELGGQGVALLSLGLAVFSYLLIDFSGNGSFYIFQGVLYLLFLLVWWREKSKKDTLLLGVIAGLALLLSHQAVALIFAYVAHLIFVKRPGFKLIFASLVLFLLPAVLIYLPWGLRNYFFIGNFFPPADMYYVWDKLGFARRINGDIITYAPTLATYFELAKKVFTNWLPYNLYFINRQLFFLAPLVYVFALFLAAEVLFFKKWKKLSDGGFRKLLPLFLILGFHILISAVWPVTKFRYFVPMLPLVFLAGSYWITDFISNRRLKLLAAGSSFALLILLSIFTYFSTPSRTYFYGGTVTTDNFGSKGELEYIRNYESSGRDPAL